LGGASDPRRHLDAAASRKSEVNKRINQKKEHHHEHENHDGCSGAAGVTGRREQYGGLRVGYHKEKRLII
jgi:hypothetical protein